LIQSELSDDEKRDAVKYTVNALMRIDIDGQPSPVFVTQARPLQRASRGVCSPERAPPKPSRVGPSLPLEHARRLRGDIERGRTRRG
jgi:hypothetical protein